MRVAIYARVSTQAQEARGTIGSQLETLRKRVASENHELVEEFLDDGYSGARLDRPGLDALRDGAEAGLFEVVWCLSPDRLARVYVYQVLIMDELARHGVDVFFNDAPALTDDPQARLLTQVQGVIAEYERAKQAERYRRGKLWRSRAGEVLSWRVPYGYRRVPRSGEVPARVEVHEPEAEVVRSIFNDFVVENYSLRKIIRRLFADEIPSPTGRAMWSSSMISKLVRNEAYVGRLYYNRTELQPGSQPGKRGRQVPRPRNEWVAIPVPRIVDDELFEAVPGVSRDNSHWSPRKSPPGHFLLRGIVQCGVCSVGAICNKTRDRKDKEHYHYRCRHHDALVAGGEHRRCREGKIRADALDEFVFDQLRNALLRPDLLLAGKRAVASREITLDDDLLAGQITRIERKAESLHTEARRLADLYQTSLIDRIELQRRTKDLDARRKINAEQHHALVAQQEALTRDNRLHARIAAFADRVVASLDNLDFDQKQRIIRLVIEKVRVHGTMVEIHLRIPLDEVSGDPKPPSGRRRRTGAAALSSNDRLRSLGGEEVRRLGQAREEWAPSCERRN